MAHTEFHAPDHKDDDEDLFYPIQVNAEGEFMQSIVSVDPGGRWIFLTTREGRTRYRPNTAQQVIDALNEAIDWCDTYHPHRGD